MEIGLLIAENQDIQTILTFTKRISLTVLDTSLTYFSNFNLYFLIFFLQEGRTTALNLGKFLRQKYNSFLGDFYYPEIIKCQSSDKNRTKMTLEYVLEELFPAQKIPYDILPLYEDPVSFKTNSTVFPGLC